MTLTHLSLQRARRMPYAPTNEQRLSGLRAVAPVERHNAYRWPFHSSQPVGSPPPTTGPVGCFSPADDDFLDSDGNALDYASLSRGR